MSHHVPQGRVKAQGKRRSAPGGDVVCDLCPRHCRIPPNHAGDCRVRINVNGELVASTYGRPCTVHLDPIEKKPLNHVLPGTRILSVATVGCNLHCKNCQNHTISQANPWDRHVRVVNLRQGSFGVSPDDLVRLAQARGCPSIAGTYSEPLVFYEYTRDTATRAQAAGLKMVTVTAGYLNAGPLRALCRHIDASNLDIKTMRPSAFRENSGGELRHVLRGAVIAKEEGVWLEITSLLIPTFNDSPREIRQLCQFVHKNLGADTPLHFSRFWPRFRLKNLPPTPMETLRRAYDIAREEGLHYPYVGNVPGASGEHTYCPGCGQAVIERVGYQIRANRLKDGACPACGHPIAGVWR